MYLRMTGVTKSYRTVSRTDRLRIITRAVVFLLMISLASICSARFAGGSGTANDPWQIATADHLNNIRHYLGEAHQDKFFEQTANISLHTPPFSQGFGWMPLGSGTSPFTGSFNGNGYRISHITVNRPAVRFQGLFGTVYGGVIRNVNLVHVNISGGRYVGALAGQIRSYAVIDNCHSSGNVNANSYAGGLIGESRTFSTIVNSSSSCRVAGRVDYVGGLTGNQTNSSITKNSFSTGIMFGNSYVGGITGRQSNNSSIKKSYSNSHIEGNNNVGGLVGEQFGNSSVSDSYSMRGVNGNSYVGGLIGSNRAARVSNSFSRTRVSGEDFTGGLIGFNDDHNTVSRSYWDVEVSNRNESAGGEGRSTEEMTHPYSDNSFVDWDFANVWFADINNIVNNGYPGLRWQITISPYPDVATNPTPANGQLNVPVDIEAVGWRYRTSPMYAEPSGFFVYISRDDDFCDDDDFIWVPFCEDEEYFYSREIIAGIQHETTYYWRVVPTVNHPDDERVDAQNVPVWQFTTELDAANPLPADNPFPEDNTYNVSVNLPALRWTFIPDSVHVDPAGFRVYLNRTGEFDEDDDFEWVPYSEFETEYSATLSEELNHAANYYWTVIPTTDEPERGGSEGERERRLQLLAPPRSRKDTRGDAVNCPVWKFVTEFAGSGSAEDPWLVGNAEQLDNVRMPITFHTGEAYFSQTADINLSHFDEKHGGWNPIGDYSRPFTGNYNGNNFIIDSLYIDRDTLDQGLFGFVDGANFSNIVLTNVNITGDTYVGGVVGRIYDGNISNSSVSGLVHGVRSVGGISGFNYRSNIDQCFSAGHIKGSYIEIGGLAGTKSFSRISNSYSTAKVTGSQGVGGLVGLNSHSSMITNSFSTGYVTGIAYIGALAGVYEDADLIVNCYWNTETSGHYRSRVAEGKTTQQMVSRETFAGWDFNEIWDITEGVSYPFHRRQQQPKSHNLPGAYSLTASIDISLPAVQLEWETIGIPSVVHIYRDDQRIDSISGQANLWTDNDTTVDHQYSYFLTAEYSHNHEVRNSLPSNTISVIVADHFASGAGTEESPWLIETATHLDNMKHYLGDSHRDKYFLQTADIDLSIAPIRDEGWAPIGDSAENSFQGVFNGNDKRIKNLLINRPRGWYQGLFGYTLGAIIENVNLVNVDVTASFRVGGLIGYSDYNTTINNCNISGRLNGYNDTGGIAGKISNTQLMKSISEVKIKGRFNVGGLAGSSSLSLIENCHSSGEFIAESSCGGIIGSAHNVYIVNSYSTANITGERNLGGLVGSFSNSELKNSFSAGDIRGDSYLGGIAGTAFHSSIYRCYSVSELHGRQQIIGGLIGRADITVIKDAYSTGTVAGNLHVGGLIGVLCSSSRLENGFSNSTVTGYENVGGLVGFTEVDNIVVNSYWDVETSGVEVSAAGLGRTTSEMTYPYADNTYIDWDFNEVWQADIDGEMNNGYPFLISVTNPLNIDDSDTVISPQKYWITNYPNPFNPETTIEFNLPFAQKVIIDIFNIKGQRVLTLADDRFEAGAHRLIWNGRDRYNRKVGSGVYFYRMRSGEFNQVRKMIMMK